MAILRMSTLAALIGDRRSTLTSIPPVLRPMRCSLAIARRVTSPLVTPSMIPFATRKVVTAPTTTAAELCRSQLSCYTMKGRWPAHTQPRPGRYTPAHHHLHPHRTIPLSSLSLLPKELRETLRKSDLDVVLPSSALSRRREVDVPLACSARWCLKGEGGRLEFRVEVR